MFCCRGFERFCAALDEVGRGQRRGAGWGRDGQASWLASGAFEACQFDRGSLLLYGGTENGRWREITTR